MSLGVPKPRAHVFDKIEAPSAAAVIEPAPFETPFD